MFSIVIAVKYFDSTQETFHNEIIWAYRIDAYRIFLWATFENFLDYEDEINRKVFISILPKYQFTIFPYSFETFPFCNIIHKDVVPKYMYMYIIYSARNILRNTNTLRGIENHTEKEAKRWGGESVRTIAELQSTSTYFNIKKQTHDRFFYL